VKVLVFIDIFVQVCQQWKSCFVGIFFQVY